MAVGGVGGLLLNVLNPGLQDRVAQDITPNPNPLAQQGGGPQNPKAVDALGHPVLQNPAQPQPNLAPAAVTQPDPVNSQTAKDLMAYANMNARAADFNRSLEGMAAGFGTAQQQASKQAALGRGGDGTVGGGLADLAGIQGIQNEQIKASEHARFMGNAAIFAQTLSQSLGRPVSVQEATEIMNNPELMQQIGGAAAGNMTTTSTQKDAEAATREWAKAHPEATPQQIADYKANLIAGGMGGSDLETRQYLQEKNQGITTDDFATWKAKKAAQATTLQQQAKDSQEFKDTAISDYSSLHTKYSQIQPYIDTLLKDPDAAQKALASFVPTTGKWGALMPGVIVPDNVKAAANALAKIQSTLSADALANTKNVRNQREFSTLGQAATGGLNPAASPEDFQRTLQDLKNKYLDAQATNELAAGHKLTGELVGHGSSDLLSPTLGNGQPNPYYNGGSEDGTPLKGDDLAKVQQALIDHPDKKQEILDQVRKNGYSPRGLF